MQDERRRRGGSAPAGLPTLKVPQCDVQCTPVISSSNPPHRGDSDVQPCSGSSSSHASRAVPAAVLEEVTALSAATSEPTMTLSTAIPPGSGHADGCASARDFVITNIPVLSYSVQGIRGPPLSFNYSKINLSVRKTGPIEPIGVLSITCASSYSPRYASIFDITFSSNHKTSLNKYINAKNKTKDMVTVGCLWSQMKRNVAGPEAPLALKYEEEFVKCLRPDNDSNMKIIPNVVLMTDKDGGHSKDGAELKPNYVDNRSSDSSTDGDTQTVAEKKADMRKKLWTMAIGGRYDGPATNAGWGIPAGLGLRGGGENSLNTGTSGWGTPPAGGGTGWGTNPPGPPQGQWGANRPPGQPAASSNQAQGTEFNQNKTQPGANQQGQGQNPNSAPPQAGQTAGNSSTGNSSGPQGAQGQAATTQGQPNTSWAQAAGKGLPTQSTPGQNQQTSANKQLEQLNTMREALFSQDGWGGQHVNQDTSWDIPASPEPGSKGESGAGGAAGAQGAAAGAATSGQQPLWKPSVNNGTDLWEANLRNGGQPPPQPQSKTPWGHTPTTNIGGTWGEEDESADSSNMWTGVPAGNQGNQNAPWPGNAAGWAGGPAEKKDWPGAGPTAGGGVGAAAGGTAGGWDELRAPGGMDPRSMSGIDPRNAMARDMLQMQDGLMRNIRPNDGGVMRGDPRGVSGRLNNTSEMWAAHQQQQAQGNKMGPNVPPAAVGNQWGGGGLPKDMSGMSNNPNKPSGWEEPSPPAQRRNIPNYDDGTSLWGQQHGRTGMQPGATAPNKGVSHWKELPGGQMGRGNMPCPQGMPQNRMPAGVAGVGGNMKPDNPVWGHPTRNGAWDGHEGPPVGGWAEENKGPGGAGGWGGDSPLTPNWGGAAKPTKPSGWCEDAVDSSWSHPGMQRPVPKPYSKDLIWSSKPFRMLTDMNFKKEDVENALRSTNMSLPEALELLMPRRSEEHSLDQSQLGRAMNPQHQVPFTPGGPGNVGNNSAVATAGLLNNPNLATMNNMKLLGQQPPGQQGAGQLGQPSQRPGGGAAAGSQPSPQQLKMLVQQIQMAVQAGYLNHQILSQPLAPQTLILLNQLLQQIKIMQQLTQQQGLLAIGGGTLAKNNSAAIQLTVQIAKAKQTITNYQNQIAAQQATYMKQQQQQHMLPQGDSPVDLFKSSLGDPMSAMQPNFSELSVNKDAPSMPSFQSQQSRLNQWKLPSLDKDVDASEFSRAPGTTTAKTILPQSHSSPNINPLLGQSDGTWSSVSRSNSDTGWPDSTSSDMTPDSKDSQWTSSQQGSNAFADIIPEFEPGKPWKGTQMKTVEDDPSITPGSVARSPLSLATIKDTDILTGNSKSSPTATSSATDTIAGLSSSPWSFNPSSTSVYTSPLSKLTNTKGWADNSELWSVSSVNKRGPPPGLSSKVPQSNWSGSRGSWASSPSGWGSSWLLLRNLTPQIDGSTLKTLCLQHGPLHNFHLYLNHGIALAKYSSREEANKAQTALNSCVLGNTTIFAESPGDSDVATMLSSLGHGQPQGGPQSATSQNWNLRGQSKQAGVNDAWPAPSASSTLWQPNPSGATLWGSDGESHRTTPSASLNSFLPPDLLNGESM